MLVWTSVWTVLLFAGIAVLMPLYGRLIREIAKHHPDEYESLGRPTLLMGSPDRSLRLQRFLYVGARRPGIHPEVARLSRRLAILTPAFVFVVFAVLVRGLATQL